MSRAPRAGSGLAKALQAELQDDPATVAVKAFAKQAAEDAQPDELPELSGADRQDPAHGASARNLPDDGSKPCTRWPSGTAGCGFSQGRN